MGTIGTFGLGLLVMAHVFGLGEDKRTESASNHSVPYATVEFWAPENATTKKAASTTAAPVTVTTVGAVTTAEVISSQPPTASMAAEAAVSQSVDHLQFKIAKSELNLAEKEAESMNKTKRSENGSVSGVSGGSSFSGAAVTAPPPAPAFYVFLPIFALVINTNF